MKLEQYYRVETVALSVIALFAAAVVWATLTAPATNVSAILEMLWFAGTIYLVILSIRRELGIISSPRVRPWMLLALSLFVFFVLATQIDELGAGGLPKILSFVMYLVLSVLLFYAAIVKYLLLIQEPD